MPNPKGLTSRQPFIFTQKTNIRSRGPVGVTGRIVKKITFKKGLTSLCISDILCIEREVKKMIWMIFVIWFIFAIACGIMEKKTDNQFYMFLFFVSLPIMFYVPFMV